MSKILLSQLREKDVINLCNASRLGYINEVEFDSCSGQITALVLCRNTGLFGWGKEDSLLLPWSRIECIVEDAVLVKISDEEYTCLASEKSKRKKTRGYDCK